MSWLHTWAGVVLGAVLFAIFWMGSLSVFDREIDRWMAPATRFAAPTEPVVSIDALRRFYDAAVDAKSPVWGVTLPTERAPAIRVSWREGSAPAERFIDPSTGAILPDAGTLGGTRFLYPFHYMLHVRAGQIGYWFVGLAGMAMMALCVSGIVVHRKLFADFFTLRADRMPRRLILDLHNVSGVLALPFHFVISLSGLMIFATLYFPSTWQVAYEGDQRTFSAEAHGTIRLQRAGRPAGMSSFDAMVAEARRLWGGGALRAVVVRNPGDANAVVEVGRLDPGSVGTSYDVALFDGPSGKLIGHRIGTPPVLTIERFVSGLHLVQFRHWTLRWLYFGLGLAGCVVIATGYLFWLEARRQRHAQYGLGGVRVVEGMVVGSVTGIVIATFAFFVVNRLLPPATTVLGQSRAALEVWTFYLVWLAMLAHAWVRPGRAWAEQCWFVATLAVAAAMLNWSTTGDHLWISLSHRSLWPIAGMDLLLLASAVIAVFAARRLRS